MFVKRLVALSALVFFFSTLIIGCGGGSSHSSGGTTPTPTLAIASVAPPVGYVGSTYTATTLSATGGSGSGYTWAVASGSALPAGINLSAVGVLSGKPTAEGTTKFGVTVTDSAKNTASAQISVVVKAGVTVGTTALPGGYVGAAYSQTLSAAGGTGSAYSWAVASGSALPDGLTLTAAGVLSGKPTTAGAASFSVTVTDSAQNTATAQLSATINPGVTVTDPGTLNGTVLLPFTHQLVATGGSGTSYVWTVAGTPAAAARPRRMAIVSGLPAGLFLSPEGIVSGTPTAAGTYAASVSVTDSAGNVGSGALSFNILGGIAITTPSTLPGGFPADNYTVTLAASGGSGTGYSWVVTGGSNLPPGLALNAVTGVLSGTLPGVGTYTFSVTVMDSAFNTTSATFSLAVTNTIRFSTGTTLPATYAGIAYSTTLRARGGSGGYTYKAGATPLPAWLILSPTGVLSGTPTSAGTFTFSVTVTDSDADTATATFTLVVKPAVTLTSPAALPAAAVGTPYAQTLQVTGGSGSGYLWTLTSGGPSLTAVGLNFSNGVVSGTPTATGTATFAISVTDTSLTRAAGTFAIAVNPAGATFAVSGRIALANVCGSPTVPAITVSINTNPVQTTTTDGTGNYSFPSVAPGSYTITPSITGPSSVFYPAATPATVNSSALSGQNFTVSLGYTVSGSVIYSGAQTGQVYVLLTNSCGNNPLGTSLQSPGDFTIRGVPPGSYTLGAAMDSIGFGAPNDADAAGIAASAVEIKGTDVTGASVTMSDPSQLALTTGPGLNLITPADSGVVINFSPISAQNSLFNQVELANSYDVEWSTDAGFSSVAGHVTLNATGANGTGVLFINSGMAGISGALTNGTKYYFRARGHNSAGDSSYTSYPSSITVGAETWTNTVTGQVTFPSAASGPLYVGLYDPSSGAVYTQRIANPVNPQPYSVTVPTGSYYAVAIIDQNKDGMIDAGDLSNIQNNAAMTVVPAVSQVDMVLLGDHSSATVVTQHVRVVNNGTSGDSYSLILDVTQGGKLPVSVTLTSGPHVINPVDLGRCLACGNARFTYAVNLAGYVPAIGDAYQFAVTYSDATTETVTATVTDVLNAFATNMSPSGSGTATVTPTFTWSDPASAGSYSYQFYLYNTSSMVWQIPGNNAHSAGFDSSLTTLPWRSDPTGGGSLPTVTQLTSGATYYWQILATDSKGNSAATLTQFVP